MRHIVSESDLKESLDQEILIVSCASAVKRKNKSISYNPSSQVFKVSMKRKEDEKTTEHIYVLPKYAVEKYNSYDI